MKLIDLGLGGCNGNETCMWHIMGGGKHFFEVSFRGGRTLFSVKFKGGRRDF